MRQIAETLAKLTFFLLLFPFFSLNPPQEALLDRLGKNAVPFALEIGTLAPPSVQLLPAKRYTGAPIGTSYDVRVYTGKF